MPLQVYQQQPDPELYQSVFDAKNMLCFWIKLPSCQWVEMQVSNAPRKAYFESDGIPHERQRTYHRPASSSECLTMKICFFSIQRGAGEARHVVIRIREHQPFRAKGLLHRMTSCQISLRRESLRSSVVLEVQSFLTRTYDSTFVSMSVNPAARDLA